MKSNLLILIALFFLIDGYSQDPYCMFGPEVATDSNPKELMPEFKYHPDLMADFTYQIKNFKNDKVISTEIVNMHTSDPEDLDYHSIFDVRNTSLNSVTSGIAFTTLKRTDTISYSPKNNEVIFDHPKSEQLYATPGIKESLDELVYINNGRIIATQDQSTFIKYFYDTNRNISEITSYQSILELNERSENPFPVFIMSPLSYVKINYDSSNRMTDKWIYSNQELYFENENPEYNEALIVHHVKYKYSDRDLIDQSTLSTFFIKSFQENDPAAKEYDKLTNDVETIDFNKLLKFLHSKDVYLKSYTYNTSNQITKKSVDKEQWRFRNNELIKTNSLEVSYISIAQNDNKITVDEEIVMDNNTSDKQRYRTIYVTDQNSYLTEKTTYSNKNKKGELTLETKETMSITYK